VGGGGKEHGPPHLTQVGDSGAVEDFGGSWWLWLWLWLCSWGSSILVVLW
jgi:hypothetical protein